ncbi:Cobyrinic acid a,c-diamide synthetase [hydrothermal vent metagenome]|uniref:Cobyrinic acid a,c-diamide synthetase n=1 Tax=hydrothermal vent metagenome TaxID=652676 RepID=A0A3B0TLW1_9ZZZZ
MIGAPGSGSGKTMFTLGLAAALRQNGRRVAPAKAGPDYIDTAFLSLAAQREAINLDPWAMPVLQIKARAVAHAANADLLLVEGVMGLFDGAANGAGSSADLAAMLQVPAILVVDAAHQSHSIAALVSGFVNWRKDIMIAGIVLNNVGSKRHETLLRQALRKIDVPVLGAIGRNADLKLPGRHLGLVLPGEIENGREFINKAAQIVARDCDLDKICDLAAPITAPIATSRPFKPLAPLGQNIAVARDTAFAFIYQHWLNDWRDMGASISFFSPLANQGPGKLADAVFLPGGYPELHGEQLASATNFFVGLRAALDRGALIYGECGGFMVLGQTLADKKGKTHKMAALLPHQTFIDRPRRVLGYRHLRHFSPLPWPKDLSGHEFHYSTGSRHELTPLFAASDALGNELEPMGAVLGRVMGSYAHVIDHKEDETP